jgi:His/Glu/Gln/Arg/opine family amino acid ABC transporter permease subunit
VSPDGFLKGWGPEIALGLGLTLATAAAALALGLVLALAAALAKRSRRLPLRLAGDAWTTVIQGTPELLIVLLSYFGSAIAVHKIIILATGRDLWVHVPVWISAVASLAVIFSGYAAESIRGGMMGVPASQIEAAEAFGLSRLDILLQVRIPLIWRHALPALGNNWLSLIKSTSLISLVSLEELMRKCQSAADLTGLHFRFYVVAAGIYLGLTAVNVYVLHKLEAAARRGG